MKKQLMLFSMAMLCLLGYARLSNAATDPAAKHVKLSKAKVVLNFASGMYYNSNAFPIDVLFLQYGHPVSVITLPSGYSSGSYTAPDGTYDVQLNTNDATKLATFSISGYSSVRGSSAKFSNVTFSSGNPVTLICNLP